MVDELQLLALQAWCDTSNEGLLVTDSAGTICLINARLRDLFGLQIVPRTIYGLLKQTEVAMPELRALLALADRSKYTQWGNLRIQKYPPQRLIWQRVPLTANDRVVGSTIVFRDATTEGQVELAKQSFLSMISHDLRTPLSTILGFADCSTTIEVACLTMSSRNSWSIS